MDHETIFLSPSFPSSLPHTVTHFLALGLSIICRPFSGSPPSFLPLPSSLKSARTLILLSPLQHTLSIPFPEHPLYSQAIAHRSALGHVLISSVGQGTL